MVLYSLPCRELYFKRQLRICLNLNMQRSASHAVVSVNFDFLSRMSTKNSGKSNEL